MLQFEPLQTKTLTLPISLNQKGTIYPFVTPLEPFQEVPWDILWKVSKQKINLNLNAHPIQKTYIPIHNLLCPKCQPHLFLFSPKRVILPYFTPQDLLQRSSKVMFDNLNLIQSQSNTKCYSVQPSKTKTLTLRNSVNQKVTIYPFVTPLGPFWEVQKGKKRYFL